MEKIITVKNEYNTLESIKMFVKQTSSFKCSKEYDSWDIRTNEDGQMEECVVIKKNALHGIKVHFENENALKMTYIIPSQLINAYLGKSQKQYQNILEITTNKIKDALLKPAQIKAFEEMEHVFYKIST